MTNEQRPKRSESEPCRYQGIQKELFRPGGSVCKGPEAEVSMACSGHSTEQGVREKAARSTASFAGARTLITSRERRDLFGGFGRNIRM